MDYSMLLFYGLAADLYSSRGNGELDHLSDYMLRDIGYKRVDGRIVKDEDPSEMRMVQRLGWLWPALGASRLMPGSRSVSQH